MSRLGLVAAAVMVLFGCQKPGPGNFERYAHNKAGFKVLKEYITDGSNPVEHRVEAALVLTRNGFGLDMRDVVKEAPDRDKLAISFARALLKKLDELGPTPRKATEYKDTLFSLLALLPRKEKTEVQRALARWIFDGLTQKSSREQVRQYVEPRASTAQIGELGLAGVDGACLLIRHGFNVDRLARYILKLKNESAEKRLLEALKTLHRSTPDALIPIDHVVIISKIRSQEALVYLLDIATDQKQEADVRAEAYNGAVDMLEDKKLMKGAQKMVLDKLRLMLSGNDPDDRWAAAKYLLKLRGLEAADEVLGALKDDGIYPDAIEDPMKTVVDFCSDVVLKELPKEDAWKLIRRLLRSHNRVHEALGIICVKASGDMSKLGTLSRLIRSKTSLESVLGQDITVGKLARNAIDGVRMMDEVERLRASGKLSKEEARLKRFAILVNLTETDDDYARMVEAFFMKLKEHRDKKKKR